jgi:uncharacterized membrane protein YvbJ
MMVNNMSNQQNNQQELYANFALSYLKSKHVNKYRMKKIVEMRDDEVIRNCHWWYEVA